MRTTIGALLALVVLSACSGPLRPMAAPLPLNRNAALASTYGLPESPNAAAQRQFKKMDRNGDGYLSDAEYLAGQMGDYRESDAAEVKLYLAKQFAGFDTNKDRRLSLAEFIGPQAKATPTTKAPVTAKAAATKR